MIKEQFVSFETAKLLKEAGFDVPCRGVYVTDRTGYYEFREYDNKQTKDDLCWNTEDGFQYEYLAPTQSLAARWLREVHGINVFPVYQYLPEKWSYVIQDMAYVNSEKGMKLHTDVFDSCEESLESGLREAIKLIKK